MARIPTPPSVAQLIPIDPEDTCARYAPLSFVKTLSVPAPTTSTGTPEKSATLWKASPPLSDVSSVFRTVSVVSGTAPPSPAVPPSTADGV